MNKTEPNQIYNNLKTIEKSHRHNNITYWKFQCLLCGNEHITRLQDVRRGRIKSCGCIKNVKQNNGQWKGIGDMPGRYYSYYKKGALKRNIEWNITLEDMHDEYIKQNKKCIYTGIELDISANTVQSRTANNASLDRIDSNFGYIKGNIQWVYKPINILKNTLTHNEFVKLCIMVANQYEKK